MLAHCRGLISVQAVLSFIVLVVLLLSTGPNPQLRVIPWFIWGQLALDVFMWIIWVAAAGTTTLGCNDLCDACSALYSANDLYCTCSGATYQWDKRDQSPAPAAVLARSLHERAYGKSHKFGGGRVAGRVALDSIITVTFAFTTAMGIFWIFKNRRSGAANVALAPSASPQHLESQPVAQSTQVYPDKMDGTYPNQPQQQGAYPPQGQVQMQQGGYPQPAANVQPSMYPNSGLQGSMPEYNNPTHQNQSQQPQYPHDHGEIGSHPTEYKSVSPVSGH